MRAFGEIAERLRRSTVQVFADRRGGGSGVIWTSDGAIMTNAHVARKDAAEVRLWDGRSFPARVTSRDARRDLAVLRIEAGGLNAASGAAASGLAAASGSAAAPGLAAASGLEPAVVGDSSALRPGELVMAIGSPLGFAGALSTGVAHSSGGGWIYANVRLAPGNSGGPLANARGEVIGINTAIVNGLGMAVPSNAAAEFLLQGPRPALGVTLQPEAHGLRILQVEPNGPAAGASLREGDLLLGSFEELTAALDSGREVLPVRFLRGERVREAYVLLRARAEAA
jgi:serine protease Do